MEQSAKVSEGYWDLICVFLLGWRKHGWLDSLWNPHCVMERKEDISIVVKKYFH